MFGDFWGWVSQSISDISYSLVQVIGAIWEALLQVLNVIWQVVVFVWNSLVYVAKVLWRGLSALKLGKFKAIWGAIKRGYERVRRILETVRRRIYDPIDRIRRQIMDVYRRFFAPLVRFLDSLRVMVRIVAIFNRRLAAKLDARLWALEAKLLSPITDSLRRLNSISSQFSALVTTLGYLDRVTLLESMRRDASLVWEVLTNPRGRLFTAPPPPAPFSLREVSDNLSTYLESGGGPLAAQVEAMQARFDESLLLLE